MASPREITTNAYPTTANVNLSQLQFSRFRSIAGHANLHNSHVIDRVMILCDLFLFCMQLTDFRGLSHHNNTIVLHLWYIGDICFELTRFGATGGWRVSTFCPLCHYGSGSPMKCLICAVGQLVHNLSAIVCKTHYTHNVSFFARPICRTGRVCRVAS